MSELSFIQLLRDIDARCARIEHMVNLVHARVRVTEEDTMAVSDQVNKLVADVKANKDVVDSIKASWDGFHNIVQQEVNDLRDALAQKGINDPAVTQAMADLEQATSNLSGVKDQIAQAVVENTQAANPSAPAPTPAPEQPAPAPAAPAPAPEQPAPAPEQPAPTPPPDQTAPANADATSKPAG